MQPSLGSAYPYMGFLGAEYPWKRSLTGQGPVVQRTTQEFVKFMQLADSFLPHYIGDSSEGF